MRRQQAAETRERIVAAGAEILHGFPTWNWRPLTVRAVSELAGVNERTVYRYFPSERELRDAVHTRLEEEAQVHVEELTLDTVQEVTARMLAYVSSFPLAERAPRDPTVAVGNQRQRAALLAAVAPAAADWPEADREIAAAMLDVLWSTVAYERLALDWELDPKSAIRGATWAIGLILDAIREGRRPNL